jgi:Domain of unknown function (DUF4136)
MNSVPSDTMRRLQLILIAVAVTSCASGPKVRADADPGADFSAYRSFGFMEPLGTDRTGYRSILTERLKQSVSRQLEQRGYVRNDVRPDLRVNFFVNVEQKQQITTTPTATIPYDGGYYGYRTGLYEPWPAYDVHSYEYTQGTLTIDLVDVERRQLVWSGVAEGRLTEAELRAPEEAIETAVSAVMAQYPYRGAGHDDNSSTR